MIDAYWVGIPEIFSFSRKKTILFEIRYLALAQKTGLHNLLEDLPIREKEQIGARKARDLTIQAQG